MFFAKPAFLIDLRREFALQASVKSAKRISGNSLILRHVAQREVGYADGSRYLSGRAQRLLLTYWRLF